MTFVMIMLYATFVLALLGGLSIAFILLAQWLTRNTHDPDAVH